MLLILEALNAEQGDCLLLHHGTRESPLHILLDGGVTATCATSLTPRLEELRQLRQLDEDEPLPIELLVVTHIDDDHINGIHALLQELERKRERRPWQIQDLWHNSFDDVVGNRETAAIQSLAGSELPRVRAFVAGVNTGRKLRDLSSRLRIPVNQPSDLFPDKFVMRPDEGAVALELEGLTLSVLAPAKAQLKALEKAWDTWLKQNPGKVRSGGAATDEDRTPTNLSSIVLLAEAQGRTLLLTGDSNAQEILAGLQAHGLLAQGDDSTCKVDVFKIPHHGSCRNATVELFQRVRARHYVISTNGTDKNPDLETLEMLWQARGTHKGWDLFVTFRRDEHTLIEGSGKKFEERCAALQAVQAWLDAHKVKVHYRDPDAVSVVIDLGDEKLE